MDEPWGHKMTVSIYFEGAPDEKIVDHYVECLGLMFVGAHFLGVMIDEVRDEPKDQGAS